MADEHAESPKRKMEDEAEEDNTSKKNDLSRPVFNLCGHVFRLFRADGSLAFVLPSSFELRTESVGTVEELPLRCAEGVIPSINDLEQRINEEDLPQLERFRGSIVVLSRIAAQGLVDYRRAHPGTDFGLCVITPDSSPATKVLDENKQIFGVKRVIRWGEL